MGIRMKDVAERAGVSVSTVSRVINGEAKNAAGPETVKKIWGIVKEMGYSPNQNAKNLVKCSEEQEAKTKHIGCLYSSSFDLNNDPFFSCIGLGMQRTLGKTDYNMVFSMPIGHVSYEEIYANLHKYDVNGIVLLGRIDKALLALLKKYVKYIVYAGIDSVDSTIDEVVCDGFEGSLSALDHLRRGGDHKIGFVGSTDDLEDLEHPFEQRYAAYRSFCLKYGGAINPEWIVNTKHRTSGAYEEMKTYLKTAKTLPQAFFCANDAIAFGVMRALREKNIKVPHDIRVVGFDNVEMTEFFVPQLTSVGIPRRRLGEQAISILIERIEGKRDYPIQVKLPFELIERESSRKDKE